VCGGFCPPLTSGGTRADPTLVIHESHASLVHARRSLATVLSGLVVGGVLSAVALRVTEGWDFFHALYFVIITVTTVGYGDAGISDGGRWIAVATMLLGIGGTTYAFALMVQVVLAHGSDWRWRMQRRIDQLSEHTVVIGFGRMGSPLALELRRANRLIVIVERDADKLERAREQGFLVVQGDATDESVLEAAGMCRASELVCCLNDSAQNLAVVLSARDLSAQATIVGRINAPHEERRMRLAGADRVVSPLHAGAVDAARLLVRPAVTELAANHLRVGLDMGMAEVAVSEDSRLVGRQMRPVFQELPRVTFLLQVPAQGSPVMRPPPHSVIGAGDVLVVAGPSDEVQHLYEAASARASAA